MTHRAQFDAAIREAEIEAESRVPDELRPVLLSKLIEHGSKMLEAAIHAHLIRMQK
jgi:hypothetical protein